MQRRGDGTKRVGGNPSAPCLYTIARQTGDNIASPDPRQGRHSLYSTNQIERGSVCQALRTKPKRNAFRIRSQRAEDHPCRREVYLPCL